MYLGLVSVDHKKGGHAEPRLTDYGWRYLGYHPIIPRRRSNSPKVKEYERMKKKLLAEVRVEIPKLLA
jgi:hypothetical protein